MIKDRPSILSAWSIAIILAAGGLQIASADEHQPVAEAAIVKRGSLLYLQCVACHDVTASKPGDQEGDVLQKVGPSLHGVLNRSAATQEGYQYSEALRKAGLIWEESTLDRWLQGPAALVPGTTMVYPGLPKESDRRALIAFLKSFTR